MNRSNLYITLNILLNINLIIANNKHEVIRVPFDQSMQANYTHNYFFALTCPYWKLVKKLFNDHIILDQKFTIKPRIPKKIHQIWLGSPLPAKYKSLQKSWKKYHPDWKYKLWTDKDVINIKNQYKHLFNKIRNFGQESDVIRLKILLDEGGLYADMDFRCLQPFDALHHVCDFYIGLGHTSFVFLYNGLMGTAPGHPIIKHALETIVLSGDLTDNNNIQKTTGPFHITRCFLELAPNIRGPIVALPITYLYPFPNNMRKLSRNKPLVDTYIKPESLAVHYWDCSWMKK